MKKFFLFAVVLVFLFASVSATLNEGYCVTAEVSDISPSSIGINEDFTVGIQIENCGEELPSDVKFQIISLPDDITVKEPMVIEIPAINYANSERFIVYHMSTATDAKPGLHRIETRLSYLGGFLVLDKDLNISIDVIGDEAELNIASVKTKPVLPYKGDTVELTLRIENFGKGDANSVKVYANHSFSGIKEAFLGTLNSDEDGPAIFTFIVDKSGEFEFPVIVSYQDDFGNHEIRANINLTILRKKINWIGIFLGLIILAVIVLLIFFYFRTKKEKNKIIQQLLKGTYNEIEHLEHAYLGKPSKKTKRGG